MPSVNDTIAALATPAGTSAIALIRLSGPDAARIATELRKGKAPQPRLASHGDYLDTQGKRLDDVVYTFFQGPKSYTGEDLLEIACHGNPYITQLIIEDLFKRGCRPAEPGEFTQRAFLGGRMDLSQAEAVMDIIHARSERALHAAQEQLRGSLGRRMDELISELLLALAQLEAYIDFPDEDLPPENQMALLGGLHKALETSGQLLATSHYGEILREGIRTVILGEPNAGKSSLLNRLVGRDRAIVSPEPGTTRDFIEECILIGPHYLRLIDTAGLNPNPQAIERLGMEKTIERGEEADLFLVVLDRSRPVPALPSQLLGHMTAENTLVLLNKSDLGDTLPPLPSPLDGFRQLSLSTLHNTGITELRQAISQVADSFQQHVGGELIAINARHARALERAQLSLSEAIRKLQAREPVELLTSDLREALDACGEIAGRIDNERMLDALFASFCIGK